MLVFVYGTLTDGDTAESVLESFTYEGSATLDGLRRVEGEYPTLAPGDETAGRLLTTDDAESLDRYEGVDRGLYVRVPIPVDGRAGAVQTYVGDPDALDAPASWPGTGTLRDRVVRYVDEHDVSVVPER